MTICREDGASGDDTAVKIKRQAAAHLKNEPLSVCAGVIQRRRVLGHFHVKLGNATLQVLVQLGNLDEEPHNPHTAGSAFTLFPENIELDL